MLHHTWRRSEHHQLQPLFLSAPCEALAHLVITRAVDMFHLKAARLTQCLETLQICDSFSTLRIWQEKVRCTLTDGANINTRVDTIGPHMFCFTSNLTLKRHCISWTRTGLNHPTSYTSISDKSHGAARFDDRLSRCTAQRQPANSKVQGRKCRHLTLWTINTATWRESKKKSTS